MCCEMVREGGDYTVGTLQSEGDVCCEMVREGGDYTVGTLQSEGDVCCEYAVVTWSKQGRYECLWTLMV